MSKMRFLISLVLAASILVTQAGSALAQKSTLITGTIQSITLETDPNTGITTVILEVARANQPSQTVRLSQKTAVTIGLVILDEDGKPVINKKALGQSIEIDPAVVIPEQPEDPHPIGNALSTFFADVPGVDYEAIMAAHDQGVSFGVIAQALWLTKELGGNAGVFDDLLTARQTDDYTAFLLEDGSVPKNWRQLRKAILDGKKLGKVGDDTVPSQNNGNGQNKDKGKDKGKDNGGSGNDKDKEKNK